MNYNNVPIIILLHIFISYLSIHGMEQLKEKYIEQTSILIDKNKNNETVLLKDLINYVILAEQYIDTEPIDKKSIEKNIQKINNVIDKTMDPNVKTAAILLSADYTVFTTETLTQYLYQLFSTQSNISINSPLFQQLSDVSESARRLLINRKRQQKIE
jgi:hypothetical protein